MKTAIAYYRVSTSGQGKSGLGLEAQREAVERFAQSEGITLIASFQEIESGKGADAMDRRPVLAAALAAAKEGNIMINKILCFFGFHSWKLILPPPWFHCTETYRRIRVCKHCGARK